MVPKYYLVKQKIVEMINNEEIGPDGLIPSERELMGIFGLSRITVKKAIDDLVNEGYLYRIQGKGTFVKKDTLDQDLITITSCTQDILKLGMTPSRDFSSRRLLRLTKLCSRNYSLVRGTRYIKLSVYIMQTMNLLT